MDLCSESWYFFPDCCADALALYCPVPLKIFTEDIVLEIDGRNIEMMDFEAAKRLCRGLEGSVARLTIDRAGRRFRVRRRCDHSKDCEKEVWLKGQQSR